MLLLILLLLLLQAFNFLLQLPDERFNTVNILFCARQSGLQLQRIAVGLNVLFERIHNVLQGFRAYSGGGFFFGNTPFCRCRFTIQRAELVKGLGGVHLPQLVQRRCLQRCVLVQQGE